MCNVDINGVVLCISCCLSRFKLSSVSLRFIHGLCCGFYLRQTARGFLVPSPLSRAPRPCRTGLFLFHPSLSTGKCCRPSSSQNVCASISHPEPLLFEGMDYSRSLSSISSFYRLKTVSLRKMACLRLCCQRPLPHLCPAFFPPLLLFLPFLPPPAQSPIALFSLTPPWLGS